MSVNLYKNHYLAPMLCGLALFGLVRGASAQVLTDGDFNRFSSGAPAYNTVQYLGGGSPSTVLNGWSANGGYNFVSTMSSSGSGNYDDTISTQGGTTMVNPALGGSYTGAKVIGLPFAGYTGNVIDADGAYGVAAMTQTITGLVNGQSYKVSFYWAAAQQSGYTTTTTEYWDVSLGGGTPLQTTTANLQGSAGGYASDFSGWSLVTDTFTATNTSEVLSFLAGGSPSGEPPFSLLADVQMTVAPEPSVLFAGALLLLPMGFQAYRKLRRKAPVQR